MKTLGRLFAALINKFKKEKKQPTDLTRIELSDNIDDVLNQMLQKNNDQGKSYWHFFKNQLVDEIDNKSPIENKFLAYVIPFAFISFFAIFTLLYGIQEKIYWLIVLSGSITFIWPFSVVWIPVIYYLKSKNPPTLTTNHLTSENKAQLIVDLFKKIIEENRNKVIGVNSDFGKLLAECEETQAKVYSSVLYWGNKCRLADVGHGDSKKFYKQQMDAAQAMHDRTRAVLERLNEQKKTLLANFNKLEERLSEIGSTVNDHYESKNLETLAKKVGDLEYKAQHVSSDIISNFAREITELQRSAAMLEVISHQALAQGPFNLPLLENMAQKIEDSRVEAEQTKEKVLQLVR